MKLLRNRLIARTIRTRIKLRAIPQKIWVGGYFVPREIVRASLRAPDQMIAAGGVQ